ncbi:hypothetical protein B0H17DRAFT_1039319 [Mycena rosella]|uniref:Proteophosphoglycan ppg4 n=1 Tax=Mycena rosella TaxID=1033263 RepID=A0AAD7GSG8_MYCRO|nr:hypothetical protein B0H17DRAFT_1039319 [Mycena rosella]
MLLPSLQPRASGDGTPPSSMSPTTWIPIAVVVSVLTLFTVLACTRKSIRSRLASMGNGVAAASGMPVTRELTAEQLAGSINRAPGAPAARARRPPRRTPSQISTVSLPAYMKEPGEQELVVSRGPDGEDVAMPAASAVDDEEDQSNDDHQQSNELRHSDAHDNPRYSPMPHTPTDSPLLGPDPRGDAPAYFEVVEPDAEHYPPGISIASPGPEDPTPQRRSGFFSMFRPAPPPIPAPSASPTNDSSPLSLTHTRTLSTTAPSLAPSALPTRHRASTSTSTLFSLSRKKSSASLSANNLTSPSLISLASISHPLPHTLFKTEFTALPKNGLTPEQLSLISGTKEGGLGRFGVPWGDAAVAYAHASASTSRVALGEDGEAPPPGWEEVSIQPSTSQQEAETSGSGSQEAEQEASPSGSGSQEEPAVSEPTPIVPLTRADSRASGMSTQSFATAEEGASEDPHNDGSDAQFRMHVHEPTDATVRP